jgi:sigma-E factor negative regulatory protein RseC
MIEEPGTIVDIQGDTAWVETQRRSTCDKCTINSGCGSATLAKVLGNRRSVVEVVNAFGARVGDEVMLGLQESSLVRGSLAVYGVPLGAMLIIALLADALARGVDIVSHETAVIAGGLTGLIAGFYWVYRFSKKIRHDSRYQPVILRLAPATTEHRYKDTRILI